MSPAGRAVQFGDAPLGGVIRVAGPQRRPSWRLVLPRTPRTRTRRAPQVGKERLRTGPPPPTSLHGSWQQPGEGRHDCAAGPVWLGPGDLAPQHRDFMTHHHDLRVLGRLAAAQKQQPGEDPDHDQVEEAKIHKPRSWPNLVIRPNRGSQLPRRVLTRYRASNSAGQGRGYDSRHAQSQKIEHIADRNGR